MKVKLIESGKVINTTDSFGARLIEQGKAVLLPASRKRKEAEKPAVPAGDDA